MKLIMKRMALANMCMLLLAGLSTGCSEPENPDTPSGKKATISVSLSSVSFPAEGGEQRIIITTNQTDWDAYSTAQWCYITNDGVDLIISAFANNSSDPMPEAKVVIEVGEGDNTASTTTTVNQLGKEWTESASVTTDGGTIKTDGLSIVFPPSTFTATADVKIGGEGRR